MKVSLKTAVVTSLIVASQFLFMRSGAQTIPTGARTSQNSAAASGIGSINTSNFDSTYKLMHFGKEIGEDKNVALREVLPGNGFTLDCYTMPIKDNQLYDRVAFAHMAKDLKVDATPVINFFNPVNEQDLNKKFFLDFNVNKSDFGSLTPESKTFYPKLLQTIKENINNGVHMTVHGGASLTVAPGADPNLRATDSLRNISLAENRAKTVTKQIIDDLLKSGVSQQKIDQFLKTDLQFHGDSRLLIQKSGPIIENQYAELDVDGKGDKKYPYHILVVDPVSASVSNEFQKMSGQAYRVECSDNGRALELGGQIRLTDIANYTAPLTLDTHVANQSNLSIAVSAPKGMTDGTFTMQKVGGVLTLLFDDKPLAVLNNIDAQGKSINVTKLPSFVISDKAGNYHAIQLNKKLSEYYPDIVVDPIAQRNANMLSILRKADGGKGPLGMPDVIGNPAVKQVLKTLDSLGYKGELDITQIQNFLNGRDGPPGRQLPPTPARPKGLTPQQQRQLQQADANSL